MPSPDTIERQAARNRGQAPAGVRFDAEQFRNAQIIADVGRSLGASARDIQIAIMAAIVESGLRNLNYGDRDSIGMFQQRNAWGSRGARLDPRQSARMFFLGGAQGQRGLLDFKNRNRMGMGQAAQAVQVSAFPDRYAKQQTAAADLMGNLRMTGVPAATAPVTTTTTVPPTAYAAPAEPPPLQASPDALGVEAADKAVGGLGAANEPAAFSLPMTADQAAVGTAATTQATAGGTAGGGRRGSIVKAAMGFIGTPYKWGGSQPGGFDCSGLIQYAYGQQGVKLPRVSYQQANFGKRVGIDALQPGDLVAWDNSSRNNGADHIAIYAGAGEIIEAPRPGLSVRRRKLGPSEGAWGVQLSI